MLPEQMAMDYGRGLAVKLLRERVPLTAGRHDPDNAIVFIPGFFTGTTAPSTGRLTVAAKKGHGLGMQFINLAGTASQKLASLNIAALVVTGQTGPDRPATVVVTPAGVRLNFDAAAAGKTVSSTIAYLREKEVEEAAVVGIGPAGEKMLPLAAVFSTYPQGTPAYYCARGEMADIFGAKGLKALAVVSSEYCGAGVTSPDEMMACGKEAAGIIVGHPVCGGALPAHGSITLMKLMKKGRQALAQISTAPLAASAESDAVAPACGPKINRTCSPRCVVGCLNRHARTDREIFHSPAESEVQAALRDIFQIDDPAFAVELNRQAFEWGLDSVEFVFSCALYFQVETFPGGKEGLRQALDEVRRMTVHGRMIGARTMGIYKFYAERRELSSLVTRPATVEEARFSVHIPTKPAEFADMPDIEYLYTYMTLLSNLGFCLFTSFAFIDNPRSLDLFAEMFAHRTGLQVTGADLLRYAAQCLERDQEYDRMARIGGMARSMPEFVKVLYRYFGEAKDQ